MKKGQLLLGLLMCLSFRVVADGAGRLRRFERDTGTPRSPRERTVREPSEKTEPSATDDLLVELFVRPLMYGMVAGGGYAIELSEHRKPGDPIFPLMRLDMGVQYINSDIIGYGYGVELGQALLAADFRHTYYRERLFDETLHFYQLHGLYRMAAGRRLEMNLAMGAMMLHGEGTQTAFSAGLPIKYWPSRHLGVELRPMFGFFEAGTLQDVEAGLLFRYEHGAVRLGYRWVESGGESLSGPRVGVSFRF